MIGPTNSMAGTTFRCSCFQEMQWHLFVSTAIPQDEDVQPCKDGIRVSRHVLRCLPSQIGDWKNDPRWWFRPSANTLELGRRRPCMAGPVQRGETVKLGAPENGIHKTILVNRSIGFNPLPCPTSKPAMWSGDAKRSRRKGPKRP